MTQVEFENQLRELRSQKAQVMNQFSLMQNEVKEEIAAKNRQIYELSQQVQKLKVQKAGITERRLKAEKDWGDRIQGFINQYQELMGGCQHLHHRQGTAQAWMAGHYLQQRPRHGRRAQGGCNRSFQRSTSFRER